MDWTFLVFVYITSIIACFWCVNCKYEMDCKKYGHIASIQGLRDYISEVIWLFFIPAVNTVLVILALIEIILEYKETR